jgi:lysyl-tRNA synthetase class 2
VNIRKDKGLSELPIDKHLLAALKFGLPESSGVALGLDRLLMVLSGKNDIKDVVAFTLDNN